MTTQILQGGASSRRRGGPLSGWHHGANEVVDGKYRLVRPLGRGGMAEVWLAVHVHLRTEVAVKFLSAALTGDAAQTHMTLERFQFEAQISARLGSRTRHIVAVHDAGVHEDTPYLVMEYIAGRTLIEEINQKGPMDPLPLADMLDQIADALTAAHEMGIVHRDIKPSNVMLLGEPGADMMVKVADFGIAKALHADLDLDRPKETSATVILGSPNYMSPEQIRAPATISARSDIWSLGVLMYEALTNGSPFNGDTIGEVMISVSTHQFERPSLLRPALPHAVDSWFMRVLAKDPEKRFASVAEMAQSFRVAVMTVEAPARSKRKVPLLSVFVACLATIAAVSVLVARCVFDERQHVAEARLLPPVVRLSVQRSAQPPAAPPPAAAAPREAEPPARATSQANPGRPPPVLPRPLQNAAPTATATPAASPTGDRPRRKEMDKSEIL